MNNQSRHKSHQRNNEVESILQELDALLSPVQNNINQHIELLNDVQDKPILFIVGNARSGSTALLQSLAQTRLLCYPSNLISRFYYAPYIGAKLHRLFIDLDTKNEFQFKSSTAIQSTLGKTKGAESPNEFWYYWRRHFDFPEIGAIEEASLQHSNVDGFILGLQSIMQIFHKPIVLKAMIMNWNIDFLSQNIDQAKFVFIERDISYNAQSLLLARESFFGSQEQWYSFKPAEYHELMKLLPEQQVVQQVHLTNQSIIDQLNNLRSDKYIKITYDKLCNETDATIRQVLDLMNIEHDSMKPIDNLDYRDNIKLTKQSWDIIQQEINNLS